MKKGEIPRILALVILGGIVLAAVLIILIYTKTESLNFMDLAVDKWIGLR